MNKVTVVEARQEHNTNTVIAKLFHPIFFLLKISGVYIDRSDRSRFKLVLSHVFCISVTLFSIADALRVSAIYFSDRFYRFSSSEAASVVVLSLVTWNTTTLCIGQLFLLTKHVHNIKKTMNSYEKMYSIDMDIKTLGKKRIKLILSKLINVIVNAIMVFCLFTFMPETSICMTILYGFNYSNFSEKLVPISVATFRSCLHSLANLSIISFFHEFVTILASEYERINRKFNVLIQDGSNTEMDDKIEEYRRQHQALTDLLQTGNPVIQFYLLIFLSFGLPSTCFLVYGVANGGLIREDAAVILYILVISLIGFIYVTWMGARLNFKAHAIRESLFRLNLNDLPRSAIHQVQIFIAQVNGPPIGISVYDMLVIDASSILTIMGTILTYSIVIFQTSGPTQCNCNATSANTTV